MSRLRHGYTNLTRRLPGGRVEKRYEGPDARAAFERELECLTRLAGRLPVAEVVDADAAGPVLMLREVTGQHGQDLIEEGRAAEVLRALGLLHVRLRAIDPDMAPGLSGTGPVIVHGDFGPQNVLIEGGMVAVLLDWEFAHRGQPIEDLAWAEWIVRMHHPTQRDAIPELLDAARLDVDWAIRHATMIDRCRELLRRVERSGTAEAVELWQVRLRRTEQWTD